MTQICCPGCGVRFSRAAAVHLVSCPECGLPVQEAPSAEHVLGFRLATVAPEDPPVGVATAVALAFPRDPS